LNCCEKSPVRLRPNGCSALAQVAIRECFGAPSAFSIGRPGVEHILAGMMRLIVAPLGMVIFVAFPPG
jgi:hypothetical protein